MAVYKQPKSKYWWYKFTWNGEAIRESTKQTNKRVAEQMEAAHRTSLAKGEVGHTRQEAGPLAQGLRRERTSCPFVRSTFTGKVKTQKYYEYGVKALLSFEKLAAARLDAITTETIAAFVALRKERGRSNQQYQPRTSSAPQDVPPRPGVGQGREGARQRCA